MTIQPSTILFLAANPVQTQQLQLGEECRTIENKIGGAKFAGQLRFRSRWAARPDDLLQALNEDTPSVLHFSGHGSGERGLCFQSEDGSTRSVSTESLAQVIQAAGASVSVVVLNACFSEVQARALVNHVPCVIGVSGAIGDGAAITYAGAFYRALAFGRSVANAHKQGLAALGLYPLVTQLRDVQPSEEVPPSLPQLLTRHGIDADAVHIVGTSNVKRHCILHIKATLKDFNPEVIGRVTAVLQEITGDMSLCITDVNEGSVRLKLSLSPAARDRLMRLWSDGQLNEIYGFEISGILELPESADVQQQESVRASDEVVDSNVLATRAISSEVRPLAVASNSTVVYGNLLLKRSGGPYGVELEFADPEPPISPQSSPAKRRSSEDERVLALVAEGNRRDALAAMMEAHRDTVFRYCVGMLRNRELAEDVMQQVFIEAYRDIERFRGECSLRMWLIGIALHRCRDAIKLRTRRSWRFKLDERDVTAHVDPTSGSVEQLERMRLVEDLEACLEKLAPKIREIVILRFLTEMTYEGMAVLLGRNADTLRVDVSRAIPVLKQCLLRKRGDRE